MAKTEKRKSGVTASENTPFIHNENWSLSKNLCYEARALMYNNLTYLMYLSDTRLPDKEQKCVLKAKQTTESALAVIEDLFKSL